MAGTGYAVSSSTLGTNEELNFSGLKAPTYDKGKYNVYYRSNTLNGTNIWNSTSGTIQYLYEGTYLPLNVETKTTFDNEIDSSVSGLENWKTTKYYKSHASEYSLISKSNTGYIVGGGIPTDKGGLPTGTSGKYIYLRKEIQFSTNLSNSISSSEYDANNVKIYTVDTASGSTTSQITSSGNFQRYSSVKSDFDSKMSETKSFCYAIRFQSINATSSSNWSDKVTVKINGSEKENYQFLKSAINFTVNKPGYITVIISSFSNMGTKMFDLFKIDRNSDNSINTITQINKIYGDANSGTYYYDDTSKSSNLLFNFENTHSLNTKSLYYFEIPVNAGDYAICKHSTTEGTDTSTGYLNYLDIGANAGDDGSSGETVTRTKVFELLKQITEAFTYPTGVYVTDFDNAALDTKTLCITLGSTYSGKATISMSGNNANLVVNSDSSTNTGISYYDLDFTLSNNGSKITNYDIIEGEQSTITTKRMTYYDYNSDDSTLRMFRFSQSKTDEEEYGEITAETQYYATYSDSSLSSWTETSGETVYNDDGTSTEETKGIPNPLATEGIAIPTDYSESSNVFDLQLKVNKKDSFTSTYLPAVTLGANNVTSIYGYDFEMKNGENKISSDDYNLTRNDKYCLKINDEEYKQA